MAGAVARGVAQVMRWGTVGAVDFRVLPPFPQKGLHDHTSSPAPPISGPYVHFRKKLSKKKKSLPNS